MTAGGWRLAALCGLAAGAGAMLLLGELRWFRRPSLADRLGPYHARGVALRRPGAGSLRGLARPTARAVGDRVAELCGVAEDAATRLDRIHSPLDATAFRLRQLVLAGGTLGAGTMFAGIGRPPIAIGLLVVVGGPALAFLVVEQQLASASDRWQRRLTLELPVVTEQVATLVGAGYSLGAALNRVAQRGRGACATDLRLVRARVQQGLSEVDALREWATRARVAALDRLIPVLALNHEAADLGRLLAEEARSMRREVHRELVATIERRGQQVWIPVTVATLVPGVIFLAVPFIEALRLFSGT